MMTLHINIPDSALFAIIGLLIALFFGFKQMRAKKREVT